MASHFSSYRPLGYMPRTPVKSRAPAKRNQKGYIHLVVMLMVSGFLIWASVAVASIRPASADAPTPEVRSGNPGYCLTAVSSKTAPGSLVEADLCAGKPTQDFSYSSDHFVINSTYCLSSSDTSVMLESCNSSNNQDWSLDGVGYLNGANNQCLSLPSGKVGLPLWTANCNGLDSLSETWTPSIWPGKSIAEQSDSICNQAQLGARVACMAQRQWLTWQTDPKLHLALLNDYTAGNPSEEWCADFVSYIYKQAGAPFSNGERGLNGWDEYDANNIINQGFNYHSVDSGYQPSPGDIAYFNYQDGHVEIVVSGGAHPVFVYGDSGTVDPVTGNGDMAQNQITNDGSAGQLEYYLSPIY